MSLLSPIKTDLARKLLSRAFRTKYFRKRAQDEIALQIRELRTKRNMRQADLAKACLMKQSAVSRLEQAEYSAWSFKTLLRLAGALDARFRITLEPMEDVVREYHEREKNIARTEGFMVLNVFKAHEAQGANVHISYGTANDFLRLLPGRVIISDDERQRIQSLPLVQNKESLSIIPLITNGELIHS